MKPDQRSTSIFQQRRSRDYDRNMKIIKKKTIQEGAMTPRNTGRTQLKSDNQMSQQTERHLGQMQPLKAVVRKVHVEQKVKQFISKLKRNNFSNQMKVALDHKEEHVQKFVQKVQQINDQTQNRAMEGIKLNQTLDLAISLLSFMAVIYMQVISSFASFLLEFQNLQMGDEWLIITQYFCLLFAAIKIVRNFTAVKIINGYKQIKLEKIFFSYLYSIEFIMDIIFLFCVILTLSRPHSLYPVFFTYVICLLIILLSPRLDEIIMAHIHVSGATRQYLALLRLLSAYLFFNHILGTFYMAIIWAEPTKNWMIAYGIENNTWASKYDFSVYFAVSVTSMAVLGDVRPANNKQIVMTSFIMLYGISVLAYTITQMTTIFGILQQTRYQIEKKLQVLLRMGNDSRITNRFHRQISNYLVHSTESKFQVEIEERKKLIQKLPENLKAEYLQQNSHSFFQGMPFFSILRPQNKKILAETFNLEISSPGQTLTHKRQGIQKVFILKSGTMGMAYKKRNATLNGMVLDKMVVDSIAQDNPVLLNNFLYNRRKRLNYSLICQTFCTIASLQFSDLNNCMKESEIDYEFWKQFYDSDEALDEEWTIKQCQECHEFHTMFNCPKLTYMPLRSIIYIKYSSGKSKPGLEQLGSQKQFEEVKTEYLKDVRKRKNRVAAESPLKFWNNVFAPLQKLLEIDTEKNYYYFNERSLFLQKKGKIKKDLLRVLQDDYDSHDFDIPSDFQYYFKTNNPKNLIKINLRKNRRVSAPYISSIAAF